MKHSLYKDRYRFLDWEELFRRGVHKHLWLMAYHVESGEGVDLIGQKLSRKSSWVREQLHCVSNAICNETRYYGRSLPIAGTRG